MSDSAGAGLKPAQPQQRKRLRLAEYDYTSTGAYFITACVNHCAPVLAKVIGEESRLSTHGLLVKEVWDQLPEHYSIIELDEFIVMPNHVHGIIWINSPISASAGASLKPAQPPREGLRPSPTNANREGSKPASTNHGLSEIVRAFKTFSSRKINELNHTQGKAFWQRGFYEHIIRNDEDLYNTRSYIRNNPLKWEQDEYHHG